MARAQVVIAGAGHASLVALAELGRRPADADVTLVSRGAQTHYSGMVPGWIEGLYADRSMVVPLAPFARASGVALVDDEVVGADAGSVRLAGGRVLPFDVLVVNTGSVSALPGPLAAPQVVPAKPFEALIRGIAPRLDTAASFAVVGAGVGGVEIAFALKARRPDAAVAVIDRGARLLPGLPAGVASRVAALFAQHGIALHLSAEVAAVAAGGLRLASGAAVAAQCTIAITGATPPGWLAATPFERAADGFLAVDAAMRSTSHPNVLAVGDAATRPDDPRPKAGVFSVRSGPPLAKAIRALAVGRTPQAVRLQRHWLVLIATGGRHAIGTRNGLYVEGDWVWRWKDRLDRGFVARFKD